MREIKHAVAGEPVVIHVVEREEDLEQFRTFIRGNTRCLGVDSETTGLDIYGSEFRCRLVQFGTPTEAYVVPVEMGPRYQEDVRMALKGIDRLILHNASFDLQVFDVCLGLPMEELWDKVTDTRILAHLIDPRGQEEGGVGHSLENLTRKLIDAEIADDVKGLMNKLRLAHKTTKDKIWKIVPLEDPDYQLYSGMDPILAARLLQKLIPLIPASSANLIPYEHKLSAVCSMMERTGFRLDVGYTENLSGKLKAEEELATWLAAELGCANVNSTEQVADVLEARGVKIKGRTATGKRKVDKVLLDELADLEDPFAIAVQEAKKARKWRTTWVDGFLRGVDVNQRCHASINPLRARTARMSITGIPAQTLPAGDWLIRRCFLADDGHVIASVDYQAQELRVLAALSGDRTMIEAFKNNADLHQLTADAAGVDRKVGKMANFLVVYGGGAGKLAQNANIPYPLAKRTLDAFGTTYPGVAKLSAQLQREAVETGFVTTPVGRRLPVDESRAYSSLNYVIQSSSRDVTCRGLIRLHEAGFTPYLRIPVHDEIVASLPEAQAEWGAREIGRIMSEQMGPVHIGTDPEVGKRSWGSCYGSDF